MDTKLILKEYGLTEKEIEVYFALLPLGSVSLQELQKRVSLPRTTIYNTLNYLTNKGLVSKIVKQNVTFFQASDPHRLKEELEEKKKLIDSILPELSALKESIKETSSVQIYQGFKGVYTIITEVFKTKQQTYYFGSYEKSLKILQHLPEHARLLRIERKIPAKIIVENIDEPIFHTKKYKSITQMRFLDSFKEFPCMVFIYGNNVALFTLEGDLIGVIIKNEQVAKALKIVFELYWQQAKPAKL